VRGHAASKLLLGHAPVPGGSGGAPKNDRRVTGKAPLTVRRMDGSGRSEASPATAYSVFTADGSIAKDTQPLRSIPK
jgi:hypothetical protein